MKKFRLRYLPMADIDLIEIDEALGEAPVKASKFFSMLDKHTAILVSMPLMYPVYDDFPIYRKMLVLDYLVFYAVNESNGSIDIHRIINGRMDIAKQLSSERNS